MRVYGPLGVGSSGVDDLKFLLNSAAIIAVVWSAPSLAEPVKRSGAIAGKIVTAKGGEQGRFIPARTYRTAEARQDLKQGDVLRTNRSGTLSILFANRTQIRLGRNSTLVVDAKSNVSLNKGKAWGRSPRGKSNLRVRTPSATAAIRGTEWAISADEESSSLQVFEGEVELTNEFGSVTVGSGEAATVRRGQAPIKVQLVNPSGREQMLYYVRAEDALAMMGGPDDLAEAQALVNQGEWAAANTMFGNMAESPNVRERAIGTYGQYIADAQLGQEPRYPEPEDAPNSYLGRALIKAYEGDLRSAIALTEEGLVRFPDAPGLHDAKTRIALLLGEPALARQAINTALAKFPDHGRLIALDAEITAQYEGMPSAGLKRAKAAVARMPNYPAVQQTLAEIWFEKGGFKEALHAVDAALAEKPQDATLHAFRAEILLAQNEVSAAKAALDQAIALEPDLSINRRIMADYYNRVGDPEAALEEALAASAGNPSFGRGFVRLAEMQYRTGEPGLAEQQLDAANRLDPFGPSVQLAKTAIALHRLDADAAITGARNALSRYQNRGGEYANLSENQTSGSLVSQSFRLLNLEAWGRYYGDRAFDAFSPVSYPDQFLNRTPSPFVQRESDGTFDAFGSFDEAFVSSFLQGAVLEPLSVVDPTKDLLFSNRNFFEGSVGGVFLTESQRQRIGGNASVNGIINGGIPVGYNISAEWAEFDDAPIQFNLSPFLNQRKTENRTIRALIGLEPSTRDNVVGLITYELEDARSNARTQTNTDLVNQGLRAPQFRSEEESLSVSLFWNHELGYRHKFTVGGLYLKGRERTAFDNSLNESLRVEQIDPDYLLISANHAITLGKVDLRSGAEFSQLSGLSRNAEFFVPLPSNINQNENLLFRDLFEIQQRDFRAYVDIRREFGDSVTVQAQIAYRHASNRVLRAENLSGPIPVGALRNQTGNMIDVQLGLGWQPVTGHWLRGSFFSINSGLRPFTLAPVASVGLRGVQAPAADGSRVKSYIARWDAEWSPHFFTSVEYQHQNYGALDYRIPGTALSVEGDASDLDRLGIEANLWLTGNWGLRASYALSDARARSPFIAGRNSAIPGFENNFARGERLPFVPEATGQFAVTWTHAAPTRSRAQFEADYFGAQVGDNRLRVDDYVLFNATVEWEPFDRAAKFELGVFNLLGTNFDNTPGLPGPGRTISAQGTLRF